MSEKTIGRHDASLIAWHHGQNNPDFPQTRELFHKVNRLLRKSGFEVGRDPRIEEHYKCLGPTRRRGRHGALEVLIDGSGCRVEIKFFQSVVFENRNGGQYDFNKLEKMPYLVRLRFQWIEAKLLKLFAAEGYELTPPKREWHVDPLGAFNDAWNMGYERKNKINRFSRGPDGWPDDKELRLWNQIDHDGQPIRNCEQRWTIVKGRAFRCICYGGINGMWMGIYGRDRWNLTNHGAWHYRSVFPGRGRHFTDDERRKALKRDLLRAIKAKKFARAEAICRYCERIGLGVQVVEAAVA